LEEKFKPLEVMKNDFTKRIMQTKH